MMTGVPSQYCVLQTDIVNLLTSARNIASNYQPAEPANAAVKTNFDGFYDANKMADSKQVVESFLRKRLLVFKGTELKKARFVTLDHIECTTRDFIAHVKDLFNQKAHSFEKMIHLQALIVDAVEAVVNGLVLMLSEEKNFAGAKAQLIHTLNSDKFAELSHIPSGVKKDTPYQSCFKQLMDQVVSLQPLMGGREDLLFAQYILSCVRIVRDKLSLDNTDSCLCYCVTNYNEISKSAAATKLNDFKPTRMFFIQCGYSVNKFNRALCNLLDQANSVHQAKFINYCEMNKMLSLMYACIDKGISLLLAEHNKTADVMYGEMQEYLQDISSRSANQYWHGFINEIIQLQIEQTI